MRLRWCEGKADTNVNQVHSLSLGYKHKRRSRDIIHGGESMQQMAWNSVLHTPLSLSLAHEVMRADLSEKGGEGGEPMRLFPSGLNRPQMKGTHCADRAGTGKD